MEGADVSKVAVALEVLEAASNLAATFQISLARYNEMRAANGGGPLTAAQRQELANEAQASIDRL